MVGDFKCKNLKIDGCVLHTNHQRHHISAVTYNMQNHGKLQKLDFGQLDDFGKN